MNRRGDRMMKRREFITLLGGAAAAWPLAARAQQPERSCECALMGYAKGDPEAEGWVRGSTQGLHELRWVEGSNIRIDYRWPLGNAGNMSSYAAELVDLKPDVIVAAATPALAAIAQETASIPIVFVNVADPVGQGFVPNFARPGGNITGFTLSSFRWVASGSRPSMRSGRQLHKLQSFLIRQRHHISHSSFARSKRLLLHSKSRST